MSQDDNQSHNFKPAGIITRSEWVDKGLSLSSLYKIFHEGDLWQIAPGIFAEPGTLTRQEDIVQLLSAKHPHIVMSSLSALSYHGLTTQIPQSLYISVPRGSWQPRLAFCPIIVSTAKKEFMDFGVEVKKGTYGVFNVFNKERCLIDAFKNKNSIGIDVFLEALKEYKATTKVKPALLANYAQKLRVLKNITPYLETLI